jgi:glycine/D-amino acid oxidase-like deaminating enzyme
MFHARVRGKPPGLPRVPALRGVTQVHDAFYSRGYIRPMSGSERLRLSRCVTFPSETTRDPRKRKPQRACEPLEALINEYEYG